jgi:hypothetical protein
MVVLVGSVDVVEITNKLNESGYKHVGFETGKEVIFYRDLVLLVDVMEGEENRKEVRPKILTLVRDG